MKIKIIEPGFAGYTGVMGAVEFADGISVDHVSRAEANHIGACVRIESVPEIEGQEGKRLGPASEILEAIEKRAPVVPPLERGLEAIVETAVKLKDALEKLKAQTAAYTEESLAEIADKKGIAGLREIADPLGIKGRGIRELITAIMAHQAGHEVEEAGEGDE